MRGGGKIYVGVAKGEVLGDVDMDMIVGGSEMVVVGDERGIRREIGGDVV